MSWILILLSTIVVLLVRSSGTASIESPMNSTHISESNMSSPMNSTEYDYLRGTVLMEFNQNIIDTYANEGLYLPEINDHDSNLNVSDFTVPSPLPNITCTRRDYTDDVAAVFKENTGPISDAFVVFNTTYSSFAMGRIFNTTELNELKILNETVVNCSEYSLTKSRRLNMSTKHSLVG
ncbi:unnamed protein product [Nezara viridula]|uniref:Neuropeptide n=1 Tax=Nezara viridula TaxID=85310 RepID=A0A9P0DY19_NEZVI|nr:unnamed protein product [Nezara viridula]